MLIALLRFLGWLGRRTSTRTAAVQLCASRARGRCIALRRCLLRGSSTQPMRINPPQPLTHESPVVELQFTPLVGLTGGVVLGLAAAGKYILTGRILGISGAIKGWLTVRGSRGWVWSVCPAADDCMCGLVITPSHPPTHPPTQPTTHLPTHPTHPIKPNRPTTSPGGSRSTAACLPAPSWPEPSRLLHLMFSLRATRCAWTLTPSSTPSFPVGTLSPNPDRIN
jgi:hypothetical protein